MKRTGNAEWQTNQEFDFVMYNKGRATPYQMRQLPRGEEQGRFNSSYQYSMDSTPNHVTMLNHPDYMSQSYKVPEKKPMLVEEQPLQKYVFKNAVFPPQSQFQTPPPLVCRKLKIKKPPYEQPFQQQQYQKPPEPQIDQWASNYYNQQKRFYEGQQHQQQLLRQLYDEQPPMIRGSGAMITSPYSDLNTGRMSTSADIQSLHNSPTICSAQQYNNFMDQQQGRAIHQPQPLGHSVDPSSVSQHNEMSLTPVTMGPQYVNY